MRPPSSPASSAPGDLFDTLRQLRTAMLATGSFSIVLSLLLLVPSLYMLQVYDRVLGSRNEMTLLMLTLLILGLYALYGLLEFARSSILVRVSRAMDELLSLRVFEAASREAALTHQGNPSQAMHDLLALRQFVSGTGLILFFDAPLAVVFLAAAFLVDVWLGVFMLVCCVVLAGLAWWNERRTHQPLQEANQLNARAAGYMNNSFRNTEVIQAMGMLPAVAARWQRLSRVALERQEEASVAGAQVGALTKAVRLVSQSLALGLGALLVLEGRMSAGLMVASSILLGRALAPIEMMIASWRQVVGAREAYGRLDRLLANAPKTDVGMELPEPRGQLQLEQVFVAAPGGKTPLVRNLQFALEAGRVLTIIGPSGAGKSTVARVIAGVWQPMSGTVRLDGADLSTWPRERLAPHVGFLPQDVELFEGTVAENIARLQEPDAEKVVKAAQMAGVHELILHLPQGYDTPLGPGGMALSGGQRQRIALARALYGEPKLLVLDEPNSSLDDAGEAALAQAIAACRAAGTTVVLVSHKTATLRLSDYLLFMRDGAQLTFGPRDRVLAELQPQPQPTAQPGRPAPGAGAAAPRIAPPAAPARTTTPA